MHTMSLYSTYVERIRSFSTGRLVEPDGPTACGTVWRYNLPRMITCIGLHDAVIIDIFF
jgi:hypothetical protein